MFDIGFSEIMVIAVVALIVIGPERLPRTARMLGHLLGRLQRYVNEVKADINREMELDELRRLQREVKGAAGEFEQSMRSMATEAQSTARSIEQELNTAATASSQPRTVPPPPIPATEAAPAQGAPAEAESTPRQNWLPGFDKI
jgi:sec-independent protein translocase protein TatB